MIYRSKKLLLLKNSKHTDSIAFKNAILSSCKKNDIEYLVKDLDEIQNTIELKTLLMWCDGFIVINPISDCYIHMLKSTLLEFKNKDVDNFLNVPTRLDCITESTINQIKDFDKEVLIVGRNLGLKIANVLIKKGCTVQVVHSKSKGVQEKANVSDIIIACGDFKNGIIDGSTLKKDVQILDVGGNCYNVENISDYTDFKTLGKLNVEEIIRRL